MQIRIFASFAAFAFALAAAAAADARGTATVAKATGVDRTYQNVRIRVFGRSSLRVTSADGQGTLTIHHAACSYIGELRRCLPYQFTLDQRGAKRVIALRRGAYYENVTGAALPMPHSTTDVAPHSIVLSLETARGTFISVTGTIDGAVR